MHISQVVVSIRDLDVVVSEQNSQNLDIDDNSSETYTERPDLEIGYMPPSNVIESQLVEMWEEFFSVKKIGILDDFFELGGDSLKALTVAKKIYKIFNVDINLVEFFNKSNIKLLADEITLISSFVELQAANNDESKLNEIII